MSTTRIAALYCAQRHMDYLECSVRSIHPSVERILIGVSRTAPVDRATLNRVLAIPEIAKKTEIVEGNWSAPHECMNALARLPIEQGITHAILVDPQDVYSSEGLPRILAFLDQHPSAGQFQIRANAYWKSPTYQIDPLDTIHRTVITRITPTTVFSGCSETNALPIVAIPEDVGTCHSFTYASPSRFVLERMQDARVAPDAIALWKKQIWDAWDQKRVLRNLHPEHPERFRSATRINPCALPRALARHPYLQQDVAGEATKRKPTSSVVFVATGSAAALDDFLNALARTAPDDCEIIGSAATDASIALVESIPGIKSVRVAEHSSLNAAWISGSQTATADNLIFLSDQSIVEGDWIEGFIAALEQGEPHTIYAARTFPDDLSNAERRRFLFEQQRGQNYGAQSIAKASFALESESCWACTRDTLKAQTPKRYVYLEDTLVFPLGGGGRGGEKKGDGPRIQEEFGVRPLFSPLPVPRPRASIVIPVFNNLHFTKACIDSIFQNTPPGAYELIVVDNGSSDGSREYLESLGSRIRYVRNRRNLFFARGCNRGGWAATADHIVFLNNDTLVKANWLEELLRPLQNDDTVGIAGNKQLFPGTHPTCANRVWHAGMVIGTDRMPWHAYYGFDPQHPLVNREHDCRSVSGCCLAIRRELFEQLEGFDADFQNGLEDVDLCLRAGELGYRIVYAPGSEIVHFVSRSESRFDRDTDNIQKFKARWAERLVSDESESYREAGLLTPASEPHQPRIGFVSAFNQTEPTSIYAERLLAEYPPHSYLVLGEFGIRDRRQQADDFALIRCWDREATWYYPLLRWATTLDLSIIHVNFDSALFPQGFLEVLAALRNAGKRLVATFHDTSQPIPLLSDIAQLTHAIAVNTEANRMELVLNGCDASRIHVIPPGVTPPEDRAQPDCRKQFSIPAADLLIASNGFISREMGIIETIESLAELRKTLDVSYLVLGSARPADPESNRYLERAKALARRLHLEQRVFFLEDLSEEELSDYLAAVNAVVLFHQSGRAGWSKDAARALSSGRPIVTSTDSQFVPFGDSVLRASTGTTLTRAIHSVLTNPSLANELVRNAGEFSRDHSWSKAAQRHWDLYAQVANSDHYVSSEFINTSKTPETPAQALLWSSNFYGQGQGAETARATALALSREAVALRIEDPFQEPSSVDEATRFLLHNLERTTGVGTTVRVDTHPSMWQRKANVRWNIARCQPLGDSLPDAELKALETMDAVWVSNTFHYEACLNSGIEKSKVSIVPNTLDFVTMEKGQAPIALDGLRSFNFLSVCPWDQTAGWDLLLQGFLREFNQTEDVALILVVDRPAMSAKQLQDELKRFTRSHCGREASASNVIILTSPLGMLEIAQLHKACQAFVLPCRANRWETTIMTAMAAGIPVIATNWGPQRDFMTSENSYPLDCEIRVAKGTGQTGHHAEPSLDHLRELMRRLSQRPADASIKSALARREIVDRYSWKNTADAVRRELDEIDERLRRPVQGSPHESKVPAHVCWEGPQLVNHSLALVNREMELALQESKRVELTVHRVGEDSFSGSLDPRARTLPALYDRALAGPIEIHVRHQWPPNWSPPAEGRWVLIQPWEYGSLPEEWVTNINRDVDEVWAPTTFVRQLYIQSGVDGARVRVVPNGVDTDFFKPGLKPYRLESSKSFKFLFLGGTIHRKGIDILLNAYREAFRRNDDVVLVVKDMGVSTVYSGQGMGAEIARMQSDKTSPEILYLDRDLTDIEIARLYNACDCLVHPYRGEGFGLPVLEAMACARPVIVTAGGATDDFVDSSTGYQIPARKQVFGDRSISGLKTTGDLWMLEPHPGALAERLRNVFENRESALEIGKQARLKVESGWTWKHAAEKAIERIEVLRTHPVVRHVRSVDAAVLLDLGDATAAVTRQVVESLERNSYATLKIFVLGNQSYNEFPDLEHLERLTCDQAVHHIRGHVRAPFLVLVTKPIRFSKLWFKQLADIAERIGEGPRSVTPFSVPDDSANTNDHEFQKAARLRWREHRGAYQEIQSVPLECVLLKWECLSLNTNTSATEWGDWIAHLRKEGMRSFVAEDTTVGRLAEAFVKTKNAAPPL